MTDAPGAHSSARDALLRLFDEGVPDVARVPGLFEPAEVFEWIKRAHPSARANTAADKLVAIKRSWGLAPDVPDTQNLNDPGRSAEIYRNGGLVLDPTPFLPSPDDTFESWVTRARDELGGEFGMQAPGLECASWDALDRLQDLLAPILAQTGPRTYRFNAFLGDYRRTPFGFHLDPHQEAVFQVVLVGERRGSFWEGLTLSDEDAEWIEDSNGRVPPAREPEAVLELQPGDVVFWPGTHVHGFETDGPSLALSIVVDRASPRRREEVVAQLVHATMGGRTALPPVLEPTAPTDDAVVQRRSAFPLLYERFDDELIVGVCGRTVDWPDRNSIPTAIRLFDQLRTHEALSVRALVEAHAGDQLEPEEIREVLATLEAFGYLRCSTRE